MRPLQLTISGIPVSINSGSRELLDIFQEFFRYHITGYPPEIPSSDKESRIEIELDYVAELTDREFSLNPAAELVTRTGNVELWRIGTAQDELFYFLTPGARYEIRPVKGRIIGRVSSDGIGSPHILANTWTLFPLLLALRARGRYHLHAAAVLAPDEKLWLICGPQGSGKTTLSTALGVAGWRPIADDSVMLRQSSSGWVVEALRKRFHVSRDLLDAWGEHSLGRAIPLYDDRAGIDGLERFASLEAAERSYDSVYGIVLTGIGAGRESRLNPVSKGEGLIGLAQESTYFPIWSDHVRIHWELLSRIVLAAGSYRLIAGRDILESPARASSLFSGHLSGDHFVDRT